MLKAIYEPHSHITQTKPYIFHRDGAGCIPHWHENVEILLFHTNGTVYSGNDTYSVRPGDIVVISSDTVHSVPISPGLRYDCLIIDCKYCADNEADITDIDFARVINDRTVSRLYNNTMREIQSSEKFGEAGARAALLSLVVYLCRNYSNGLLTPSLNDKSIKQALKYINSRLGERISVDETAAFAKMSKYHFCREFKKETGYTLVSYINLMRCLKAEKLISLKGYTVGEAARECGFENLSYFSKTFKNIIGVLPRNI